jgi:hypothetical protein
MERLSTDNTNCDVPVIFLMKEKSGTKFVVVALLVYSFFKERTSRTLLFRLELTGNCGLHKAGSLLRKKALKRITR